MGCWAAKLPETAYRHRDLAQRPPAPSSGGANLAASQGPGLTLNYQLAKNWKLGLTARYEETRFILDDDVPGSERLGEDRSAPLLFVLEYGPWPMTTISAVIGAEFGGSPRIEDGSGETIARSDFETAPVLGLTFSSRF